MAQQAIPAVLSSTGAETLLEHHRTHHGPAVVQAPGTSGLPVRCGNRRVATLQAQGEPAACEALARALSALAELDAEGRRSKSELTHRLRRLAERLRRAEGKLAGPFRRQHDELTRQSRELATAAATDPLSTALNRRAIEVRLREAAEDSRREAAPLAVIMCDIDHFKGVNDTHGHLTGDAVIAGVGRALRAGRRRGDAVGRWGGEEFMVLLPGCPLGPAITIAEAMCQKIRDLEFPGAKGAFGVTASFGVAAGQIQETDDEGTEVMGLVAAADDRLYAAKSSGRDQVVATDPESEARSAI